MNAYRKPGYRLPFENSSSPWTLRLLVLNALVFFGLLALIRTRAGVAIYTELWLYPPDVLRGHIWQLVTYMFVHDLGGFRHLFSNMLSLFIMGRMVEMQVGSDSFLRIYFYSGIVAGLLSFIAFGSPIVGASGAVLGIVMAAALLCPDNVIMLFLVVPIQMRYLGWLTAAWVLYEAISAQAGIAHWAHVGGLITGVVLVRTGWYRKVLFDWRKHLRQRELEQHRRKRARIDEILEKVSREGIQSLSRAEREFLENSRKNR